MVEQSRSGGTSTVLIKPKKSKKEEVKVVHMKLKADKNV